MTRDTLVNQRPFYMSRLAVDPSNPDRVFFSSEDLIETRDGGKTYEDVETAVHQDHHGLWISRDGRRIIEADDGGAPISIDGGKTWDWRYNVAIAQIYRVGYDDQNPYRVCGGIQDNDSYCGPSDSLSPLGIENSDWRDVGNDGDGSWVWPQPGDPSVDLERRRQRAQRSARHLRHALAPKLRHHAGRDRHERARVWRACRFARTGKRRLRFPLRLRSGAQVASAYYGANVLFETRDLGRTWTVISPDLTRNDPAKQQVAGGPINTDVSGAEFYDTHLRHRAVAARRATHLGGHRRRSRAAHDRSAVHTGATSRRRTSRRGDASTPSRPRASTRAAPTWPSIVT